MKIFKNLFTLLILAVLAVACSDEKAEITPAEPEFISIAIPETYRTNLENQRSNELDVAEVGIKVTKEDGEVVIGKMRFTMPATDDETLVNFEMTENLLNGTGFTESFWVDQAKIQTGQQRIASSCIASCQKEFTKDGKKVPGRGACKAECWAKTAIAAAAVVVAIVAL